MDCYVINIRASLEKIIGDIKSKGIKKSSLFEGEELMDYLNGQFDTVVISKVNRASQ